MKLFSLILTIMLFVPAIAMAATEAIAPNVSKSEYEILTELDLESLQKCTHKENNKYIEDAVHAFYDADEQYRRAKCESDASLRSVHYAEAIRKINLALKQEPQNSDYLLLASQIYRGKGGAAYAKNYFKQAEEILIKHLENCPEDIAANLDYAIACYAGDVRFYADYEAYKQGGRNFAKKVIELCEYEQRHNNLTINNLRAEAMAYLILDDKDKCNALLQHAKNLSKEYASIVDNQAADKSKYIFEAELHTKIYDVYSNTVAVSKWPWSVREEVISKEFLLLYMTDIGRFD